MSNKILFFLDNLTFGGVEQAVLRLIEGLDRNLWLPILVHHPNQNLQPLIRKADQLEIRRIETPEMPLGIVGLKGMDSFLKILRNERPAIFHAHLSWPLACKWGVVASILAAVPATVITEHLFLDISYSRAARLQQRLISNWVGKYIAVSQSIADKLVRTFKIPEHEICVIHNAVEVASFDRSTLPQELTESNKASTTPLVLTVARLDKQKGYNYLIRAARVVPEATFAIVGDGPERSVLEDQVRELGLKDRVLFFGFRNDIPNWLSACHVFVLPSLYEGLPIAILEAMAAGKPVIATDIPENREVITHGMNGWLVPPQNPDALATALRAMLADPALAQRLGLAGRNTVSQRFSIRNMICQITDVYGECLGGQPRSHG